MSYLGIENPAKKEASKEAEGKAVGGGCRHAGRAIEDCFAIYTWLPKEAIFGGWREMDSYMRDNKIETIAPQLPPSPPPPDPAALKAAKKKKKKADAEAAAAGESPAKETTETDKPAPKH